jgi:hypothetical protein
MIDRPVMRIDATTVIGAAFQIGETVYLRTGEDRDEQLVVGITIRPGPVIMYALKSGAEESWHYELEISREKSVM